VSLVGDQLSGFAADTERDSQGAAPRMRDRRRRVTSTELSLRCTLYLLVAGAAGSVARW